MRNSVAGTLLVLIGCCALGPLGTGQQSLELVNDYELVIYPDFSTDAFDSWEDAASAGEFPWILIPAADPGIGIHVAENGGFRLVGTCSDERACGGCGGTQTGYNSFTFDAEKGFEIAVRLRLHGATASFKVELHSSGKYAHATLVCDNESCSLFTCCTSCYGSDDCDAAGHRAWTDLDWWRNESHILGLIYDPETRVVRAHVDGRYWIGSATIPVELGQAILRLFVQCDPNEAERADFEILDVLMGLERE